MRPQRLFTADVGQTSIEGRGPDAIEKDIDNINRMFDPTAVFPDGSQGGIGKENINFNMGDLDVEIIEGLDGDNLGDQLRALLDLINSNDVKVVHIAGTEIILGTKIFNLSPKVPVPTSSNQAASKGYVDDRIGTEEGAIIGGDGKIDPDLLPEMPFDLESISFYSNGFIARYSSRDYRFTWAKDTSGRITSLLTEDNVTIPVTWDTGVM